MADENGELFSQAPDGKVVVADLNFDGYQDFGYMYSMGNQPTYWEFWIWKEETGQFVLEPELSENFLPPVF